MLRPPSFLTQAAVLAAALVSATALTAPSARATASAAPTPASIPGTALTLPTIPGGPGAAVPFTEYDATSTATNGTITAASRAFTRLASEATGRRAVELGANQHVEFVLARPAARTPWGPEV